MAKKRNRVGILPGEDNPEVLGRAKRRAQKRANRTERNFFGKDISGIEAIEKEKGEAEGRERVEEFLPDIGKIGGLLDTGLDADQQDVLNRFKALADTLSGELGGLTPSQTQALRETAQTGLEGQFQTQGRALTRAAAQSGVRGAAAGAQQAGLANQVLTQQRALERGLTESNIDVQNIRRQQLTQALGTQGQFVEGASKEGLARELENLAQHRRFVAGQESLFAGGEATSAARRGALRDFLIQKEAIAKAGGGGGGGIDFSGLFAQPTSKFQKGVTPGNLTRGDLPTPGTSNELGRMDQNGKFFPNTNLFGTFGFPGLGTENDLAIVDSGGGVTFKPGAFGG